MRELFEPWAAGLSDRDFAAAVAAIGARATTETRSLEDAVAISEDRAGIVSWKNPLLDADQESLPDTAGEWASRWHDVGRSVRLAVDEDLGELDVRSVVDVLRSADVDSVFIVRTGGAVAPWRFPLRFGFVDDEAGRQLRRALGERIAGDGWPRRLIDPLVLGREGTAVDVLVTTGNSVGGPRRSPVGVVVYVDTAAPQVDVEDVAQRIGATAWGIVDRSDPTNWCLDLVERLAHDEPFDVAFERTGGVLLHAPITFVLAHTARTRARAMIDALEMAAPERPVTRSGDRGDLAGSIGHIAAGHFDHESDEASRLAAAEEEAVDTLERTPRWLQAQIFNSRAPDRAVGRSFLPDTAHRIDVRIGPEDADWVAAGTAFPEDDLVIEAPLELTVVLTEPHLIETPQVGTVMLPVVGASTSCSFTLTTTAGTRSVDARLIVLSGGRVLHTAHLGRAVGGGVGAAPADAVGNAAEVETVVRSSLLGVADRRSFDAALVLNDGDDGVSRASVVGGDSAAMIPLDAVDVTNAVDKITRRLAEIVDAPGDFDALDAPGTRELLVFLAAHGSLLRRSLVAHALGDAVAEATYLQVVPAKPGAYFPLEFAYDFPGPNPDAGVCPEAINHLASADIDATCPGPHDRSVVCPFGFWAISKVIERHAFKPVADGGPGFTVRAEATRDRRRIKLGSAVYAASDRVSNVDADAATRVTTALDDATGGRATTVDTWQAWESEVAGTQPAVLLVMAHTVQDDTTETPGLEIGASDTTWAHQITPSLLPPEQPAIVALLGCATAVSGSVSYERFPGLFQTVGAKIVIGTLTEVLGRHAAPVGSRLVELLYDCCRDGPRMVGEVMVHLRRTFLAEGMPMVLALAVFGDADWILERA